MNSALFAITRLSFRAAFGERLLQLAALFAGLLFLLSLAASQLAPLAERKIVIDFGLATVHAVALVIAIFLGAQDMPRELERRTLYVVLSKPVSRVSIVLGKFLGLFGALVVLSGLMSLALVGCMALMHVQPLGAHAVAIGLGLIEIAVLLATGMVFSLLTSPTLATLYTALVFLMGHQTGVVRSYGIDEGGFTRVWTEVFYRVVPNLDVLNLRNMAVYGALPPPQQVLASACQGVAWCVVFMAIASGVFRTKEL
jgi:ABC-type transport system involved in multi-copper enzyme maturation permease subunit